MNSIQGSSGDLIYIDSKHLYSVYKVVIVGILDYISVVFLDQKVLIYRNQTRVETSNRDLFLEYQIEILIFYNIKEYNNIYAILFIKANPKVINTLDSKEQLRLKNLNLFII